MPKFFPLILALKLITFKAHAQCTLVTPSTNGYTVTTKINPVAIIPSSNNCPNGYNYNVAINYTITVTGTLPGGSLYTMQGYISCNGQSLFYDLPNNAAVGSVTTSSNPYISNDGAAYVYTSHPSCTSANVTNMGCNSVQIEINGPGIASQTTHCPNNAALPIGLSYFTATKKTNSVYLLWQTETEKNNDFFTIEKSINGADWVSVGKVKGSGTVSKTQNYSFTDNSAEAGINYYRLRQTDFDGTFTFSPIVYVVSSTAGLLCSNIFPNPATDAFMFQVNSDANGIADYVILDDVGKIIRDGSIDYYTGNTEITLPAESLKAGFYVIELTFNQTTKVYRKVAKL